MPLGEWLDDALLQAIAAENNVSETAFLVPDTSGASDYELRWFTPTAEVALCGHATLASGHFLLGEGEGDAVSFRTRQAGILRVARGDAGYELALPAWRPDPRPLPAIAAALGVAPRETLWHDKGYALLIVADEETVRGCTPDHRALEGVGRMVTIVSARGRDTDIVSRVFTPGFGMDEDPVTGSAHAVMTPYWARVLGRDSFAAYQASARGGHLGCRLDAERVVLSGACVTVIEGSFDLPESVDLNR